MLANEPIEAQHRLAALHDCHGQLTVLRAEVWRLRKDAEREVQPLVTLAQAEAMVAAERERWRGFTAHCQQVAAALRARMTTEQVIAGLSAEMDASINRMAGTDASDLDPDLVEWASQVLGPPVARLGTSETVP